jgi:hypothetical protein
MRVDLPSTVAVATDFRVDDVKAGLARKVFEILESSESGCPKRKLRLPGAIRSRGHEDLSKSQKLGELPG